MAAMRNDSRPMFEHSPASPIGGDARPIESERPDSRDTIAHGRDSHVVHQETEAQQPDAPDAGRSGHADVGRVDEDAHLTAGAAFAAAA
jgi:hypothetical protein